MLSSYVKFWIDSRTDKKTDRQTPVNNIPQIFQCRGIKSVSTPLSNSVLYESYDVTL